MACAVPVARPLLYPLLGLCCTQVSAYAVSMAWPVLFTLLACAVPVPWPVLYPWHGLCCTRGFACAVPVAWPVLSVAWPVLGTHGSSCAVPVAWPVLYPWLGLCCTHVTHKTAFGLRDPVKPSKRVKFRRTWNGPFSKKNAVLDVSQTLKPTPL